MSGYTPFARQAFESIKFHGGKKLAKTGAQLVAEHRARQGSNTVPEFASCLNPERRDSCEKDFKLFCLTYKPIEFALPFSHDHLDVIEKLERVILESELYSIAMPRGSGKTTLAETAVLWASLYGHTKYVVFIGADAGAAQQSLDSIKTDLETNDMLREDFPEVCVPIEALDGIAQRAKSQSYMGEPTKITYSQEKIVFPTLEGYPSTSGTIMECRGLTARIRGMKHKLESGEAIRPDLCIIDDPQTDQSAASASQNAKRIKLLNSAILNLAGPGKKIRAIMPCTVIERGDMADTILDRSKSPRWQGDRMKAVYAFPLNEKLWDEYAQVWRDGLSIEDGGDAGRAFYLAHREEMDEGAVVAWPERVVPGDISAIQSCMNAKIENEEAFWAEMQNEPLDPLDDPESTLTAEALAERGRNTGKGIVPSEAGRLVGFIDVGTDSGLAWSVVAYSDTYDGTIIEYGIKKVEHKKKDPKIAIWEALTELCDQMTADYRTEKGDNLRLSNLGIDAGWESDLIYRFCRESNHSGILIPTKGAFVKPGARLYGLAESGAIKGAEWVYSTVKSATRPVRLLRMNANWWKSFVFTRLRSSMGAVGSLGVYGKGSQHRTLWDHLTAEYRKQALVEGKAYDIWSVRPNRANHLFDCIVGCAVLANFGGIDTMMQGRADISNRGGRKRRVFKAT
jgi:hypothetical protein